MAQFNFRIDRKVTTYESLNYVVFAEDEDDAIKLMEAEFKSQELPSKRSHEPSSSVQFCDATLLEDEDYIHEFVNEDGTFTKVLVNEETGDDIEVE